MLWDAWVFFVLITSNWKLSACAECSDTINVCMMTSSHGNNFHIISPVLGFPAKIYCYAEIFFHVRLYKFWTNSWVADERGGFTFMWLQSNVTLFCKQYVKKCFQSIPFGKSVSLFMELLRSVIRYNDSRCRIQFTLLCSLKPISHNLVCCVDPIPYTCVLYCIIMIW